MKYSFVKEIPTCILLLVSASFLWYMYHDVLLQPNSFLFNDSGDAIKNYFTYSAQTKSGSWIQSTVMNYPYGETIFYLDCHPLLTWLLHGIDKMIPGVEDYSIGIIHILMIGSLFLSAYFIYLIFCELQINRWWAMVGAFGIMVLSPQVFRMTGHLALSYSVFIPLTWYLSIRFYKSQRKFIWSFFISVNLLFWYLIHAYLGMIALSFIAFQFLAEVFIFNYKDSKNNHNWIHFIVQVIVPVIIFWGVVALTDHHIGRTSNPWGFFANNANLKTIFLPHHGILRHWLNPLINFNNQNWDGWAYIGVSSTLILLFLIVGWIQKKRNKSTVLTSLFIQISNHAILRKALIASILLLLFAMAMPFRLGLQFLLDWFPVIKKFRGNGRFAWVFYYVMTVTSVYTLHYLYYHVVSFKFPRWAVKTFSILILFLYIGEGWTYHQDVASQYGNIPNTFTTSHLPEFYKDGLKTFDPSHFQAILPMPFYHKGSENFAKEGTDKIYLTSMTLSYHTQLPIWGSYATHTSIPEAKNSIQTLSPDYYEKAIKDEITSDKDLVLVYSKEPLNLYEEDLLDKATLFFSGVEFELYRLPINRLFQNSAVESIDSFQRQLMNEGMFKVSQFYISDSSSSFLYESFDDTPNLFKIEGDGSYHGHLSDRKTLFTVPGGTCLRDSIYQLSFWFSNFGQDITNVKLLINEVLDNGTRLTLKEIRPSSSMVINGDWSLVEMELSLKSPEHPLEVVLKGPWRLKGDYYIDELLFKKKSLDIYKVLQNDGDKITGLMKNNQRIFRKINDKK